MALPNFLIIGAQKSATTTLWGALQTHAQVFCCPIKEPRYFVAEEAWRLSPDWYARLFAGVTDELAIGEASTTYSWHPHHSGVPQRIRQALGEVRLVYVLRDPVERMRSAYTHALATGYEHRPIAKALLDERYLSPSRYAHQVEQYLECFDRSSLLLVSTEQIRADPNPVLARVLRHIGVDPEHPSVSWPADRNVSAGKRAPRLPVRLLRDTTHRLHLDEVLPARITAYRTGERPLFTRPIKPAEITPSESLRAQLRDLLAPDIERLRGLLGDDLPASELTAWQA